MSATLVSPEFATALKILRECKPEKFRVSLVPTQNAPGAGGSPASVSSARDIVVLPITWSDLLHRVQSEASPTETATRSVARFGEAVINFQRMEATRSGVPVPMTKLQFKLLEYFVANPYRVISRSELLDRVWGFQNYPTTRTVDTFMGRLRQKFERVPSDPVHFHTIHGSGYKFVP